MEVNFGTGILLSAGIDMPGQAPLDYRTLYHSWDDSSLSDIPITRLYVGMVVSDVSTATVKVLKEIPSTASYANQCIWEEVGKEYIHPGLTPTVSTSSLPVLNGGKIVAISTLSVDSSGHVSSINVSTLTLPMVTDTKQNIVATTTKSYITAVTSTPSATTASLTGVANASVYMQNGFLYSNNELVLTTASPIESAVSDWGTIGY